MHRAQPVRGTDKSNGPVTLNEVCVATLTNEMGLLEGALSRSRERVRSFKQERKGQRAMIGQTLQMALAGCQGRVLELQADLDLTRQEAAERIAQLEQELNRDKRTRATDKAKTGAGAEGNDDDGALSIGSLGSVRAANAAQASRLGRQSPRQKRAGSESRRITELENELSAMHVKVDSQQAEIEKLRAGLSGPPEISDERSSRGLRDIENAIAVQQHEYKVMIDELEETARAHAERNGELEALLAAAQRELGEKVGLIAAVEHEAGAARSQLVETEATLERKNVDIAQLTDQLQVCILELKALSEKSREAQHKQRNVFDGAKALGAARALSLQGSGFE